MAEAPCRAESEKLVVEDSVMPDNSARRKRRADMLASMLTRLPSLGELRVRARRIDGRHRYLLRHLLRYALLHPAAAMALAGMVR